MTATESGMSEPAQPSVMGSAGGGNDPGTDSDSGMSEQTRPSAPDGAQGANDPGADSESDLGLAADLSRHTLARLDEAVGGLTEVHGADGGPWMRFTSTIDGEPCGSVRVMHGGPIAELVTISLGAPAMGLDSHMIFAFTSPESLVPHFTLDSVQAPAGPPGVPGLPTGYAFHLDLIPRVDLGANLDYLDHCYAPLTEHVAAVANTDGITPAHLDARQLAIMSTWMLANRATPEAFRTITPRVDAYLDHWLSLTAGLPDEVVAATDAPDPARRDARNRSIIFNPEVDAVWAQVARLVGAEASEAARNLLATPGLPA